ncbi:hypothetical protein [Streptomyces geranii]|uniref:hypothetical protein n=1 Tax=Streptomyces geranii TaxID=2058923 RepID=UPI000D034E14|nr:hypothetical protein [Streptomyces geranii]
MLDHLPAEVEPPPSPTGPSPARSVTVGTMLTRTKPTPYSHRATVLPTRTITNPNSYTVAQRRPGLGERFSQSRQEVA